MKYGIIFLILFATANAFSQNIRIDSLKRIEDSLGNVFYQHYTELTYDKGGFSTNLTPPIDSTFYVDSVLTQMHNLYLPLTQAKIIVLNQNKYNSIFNRLNQLLSKIGVSFWDFSDRLFANQFVGLWIVKDTDEGGWERFYEGRIANNNRLIFRQVDVSFSRDTVGQRIWDGSFSNGSSNNRALIYNSNNFKFNSFDNAGALDVDFFREIPNDDNVGTNRLIFFDFSGRYRFTFLRDIKKKE